MFKLENIEYSYHNNKILNQISLSVTQGDCIGIIGANGCGKSTLLSVMAGAKKPACGKIFFDTNTADTSGYFCNRIGYVPQENPLLSDLTGYDNLMLWFRGTRKEFQAALESELIRMLEISDYLHKPIRKMSGGMKKRISIASAFINRPSVLILDEPSAALDLPGKKDIRNYLQQYLKRDGTVIITTHDEEELNLCNRIYVLKNGMLHPVKKELRGDALIALL